jgi:hypothetical protein
VQAFLAEWGPRHDVIESGLTAHEPPARRRRIARRAQS